MTVVYRVITLAWLPLALRFAHPTQIGARSKTQGAH